MPELFVLGKEREWVNKDGIKRTQELLNEAHGAMERMFPDAGEAKRVECGVEFDQTNPEIAAWTGATGRLIRMVRRDTSGGQVIDFHLEGADGEPLFDTVELRVAARPSQNPTLRAVLAERYARVAAEVIVFAGQIVVPAEEKGEVRTLQVVQGSWT